MLAITVEKGNMEPRSKSDWWTILNSSKFLPGNKCIGCGRNRHADWLRECPAQGKSCNKCGRLHHFESVCGMIPARNGSQSRPPGRSVNNCDSLTSFPRNSEHQNSMNMVPKQVLDVVNLANSGINSGKISDVI